MLLFFILADRASQGLTGTSYMYKCSTIVGAFGGAIINYWQILASSSAFKIVVSITANNKNTGTTS